MLSVDRNDLLTASSRTTPMGQLLRRYWIPALLAEELPEPDCPPVRVQLLGEGLVAFRDSRGRLGVLDELCAHRRVSLYFGRNEDCGLRCSYHGWKYDVTGQCVDMPSEPGESNFKDKVSITAYPAEEHGGIIWVYMGPEEHKPPLPALEWADLPAENRYISKRWQETNWVQAMEGGIDSSHVSFTHRYGLHEDPMHSGTAGLAYLAADGHPRFEVVESDGGLLIGARRNTEDDDTYYWRITQWIMPWYTIIPPFGAHNPLGGHAWVPIDDQHCWAWSINYHPTRALREDELASMRAGGGIHCAYLPGTFLPEANRANDYLIDREAQRRQETFSGVRGIAAQDFSLQESMGSIVDRSLERLGTSDAGIIMARRRLLRAADLLLADREPPAGLDPSAQQVRSASLLLPKDEPFQIGARDALRAVAGTDFVSI
jgi:phthalate 4,5-dioxygenase oxygenase subunit